MPKSLENRLNIFWNSRSSRCWRRRMDRSQTGHWSRNFDGCFIYRLQRWTHL